MLKRKLYKNKVMMQELPKDMQNQKMMALSIDKASVKLLKIQNEQGGGI